MDKKDALTKYFYCAGQINHPELWRTFMDNLKKAAAVSAVGLLKNGQIVGLGTGSTAEYAIEEIGRRIRDEGLKVIGIPTSKSTERLALENNIPLATLYEHPEIDVDIDGADQVDRNLDMVKGKGGAHLMEKLVALNSKKLVIIVDESKMVERLSHPVAVEVDISSLDSADESLRKLGCRTKLRTSGMKPYITDNGNYIIDCDFGVIEKPAELEKEINKIKGVLDNGIFTGFNPEVHVGTKNGVKIVKKPG